MKRNKSEIIFLWLILNIYLDENDLTHIFNNQISSLFISCKNEDESISMGSQCSEIFSKILSTFTNLRCLIFNPDAPSSDYLHFFRGETPICSNLLELHVCVSNMDECLDILDGRFHQLRILHITFNNIKFRSSNIEHTVNYF